MSSFVLPFVSGNMKMTKKKAKRHMAPYIKYVPKMSNSELKNFLMVKETTKEHVQLNLQKGKKYLITIPTYLRIVILVFTRSLGVLILLLPQRGIFRHSWPRVEVRSLLKTQVHTPSD